MSSNVLYGFYILFRDVAANFINGEGFLTQGGVNTSKPTTANKNNQHQPTTTTTRHQGSAAKAVACKTELLPLAGS